MLHIYINTLKSSAFIVRIKSGKWKDVKILISLSMLIFVDALKRFQLFMDFYHNLHSFTHAFFSSIKTYPFTTLLQKKTNIIESSDIIRLIYD